MAGAKRIIILGGGVAGLATAYYLKRACHEINYPIHLTLIEGSTCLGGMIRTHKDQGCLIEEGPDAFLSENPILLDLCRELKLTDQLLPTRQENRRSFVLQNGKLSPVPRGFYLMTPTDWKALACLPRISFYGKFRAALEWMMPPKRDLGDESIADFVTRRFGSEIYRKLAEPMLSGIYSADLSRLSLQSTFPKFKQMELEYGSVMRGFLSRAKKAEAEASGPRYSLFMTFKQGMSQLIQALAAEMGDSNICLKAKAGSIQRRGSEWIVSCENKEDFAAEALCLALPAPGAAKLFTESAPELSKALDTISFEPISIVHFLYDKYSIHKEHQGFGFVVPETEQSSILGCSFTSLKFEGRSASDHTLLRAFIGRKAFQNLKSVTDDELAEKIHMELREILSINAPPKKFWVYRYEKALPQYYVGHSDRMKEIESLSAKLENLYLTGNSYYGIGIPDTVASAKRTAEKMVKDFSYVTH